MNLSSQLHITRLWPLLFVGLFLLLCPQPAEAQNSASSRYNAAWSQGTNLNSEMVRQELERQIASTPRNEAALWNVGYHFFRTFPRNQDTARAIMQGFLSAQAQNPEQRQLLTKAAIYWEKIYLYGQANVPVGQDPNTRRKIYYGDQSKFTTLAKRPAGSAHQGFPNYDWPGRNINKRLPRRGRADNPYPGRYYPGMYPP